MNKSLLSDFIKREALRVGFASCGISKAEKLDEEAYLLEAWLNQNLNGKMAYMANYFDKRTDPRLLVEGAKSVISFSHNYFNPVKQAEGSPKISMYALGKDYHDVVKQKLEKVLEAIKGEVGEVNARCFVDSAPVLEKAWARRSGIGWQGKNANMLTKRSGSYYFLAEIILDVELEYDSPVKDFCGTCTKCIDACPTGAIYEPYKVDGSRCISYFTIELKDEVLPDDMKGKFENWMFGCDICQQVCPINAKAVKHQEPQFEPSHELLSKTANEWEQLSEENFKQLFKGSPVKRTKFAGLKRNIFFLKPD